MTDQPEPIQNFSEGEQLTRLSNALVESFGPAETFVILPRDTFKVLVEHAFSKIALEPFVVSTINVKLDEFRRHDDLLEEAALLKAIADYLPEVDG